MKSNKDNDLSDRRGAAADAKAARLRAHRAAMEAAEPTRLARQEERVAAAAAKEERTAERARIKLEDQERVDAETADQAAADIAAQVVAVAPAGGQSDRAPGSVEDEAAKKAERDRRYANRKAKKR